ncbi:MAG TPA: 3-hydroxyacyl-CoA dehydrogenase NAD-binding domain-containing protein, partial [Longimicrobiales bacterium]|nr:3-hydroxyacyl-CoA dehydrogenase NAD-binding domain-containing protein [Longimicrobiales bacterium]
MEAARTVAVVGAGTMGHGIAQVAAAAGCEVRLFDVAAGALDRGVERIRANLDRGVELGKVSDAERGATLRRIGPTTALAEAVSGAGLVVEA